MVESRRRPLKVGLMLPQAEGRMAGSTARWADLLTMATLAEQVGFDAVWTIDHLVLEDVPGQLQGVWECWSLLAALAASTSRVEIGPLVTPTSFRNPALLAKMADTVDEISGGRLILGLGAGWLEREYRMMGLPFDQRVSRFEEALTIIHGLLRDGAVDFDGRFYQARECELRPRGPRPQGPPILIGSQGERMLGLIARYADLWNAFFSATRNRPDGVPPLRERVDAACRAHGRDPATLGRTAAAMFALDLPGRTGHRDLRDLAPRPPEQHAEELRAYARQGISHIITYLDPMTPAAVAAFAPVLQLLDLS